MNTTRIFAGSTRRACERPKLPIAEIAPAGHFCSAEDYRQQYLQKRGQASCAVTLEAA